jgi:hypothetical protein
MNTDDLSPYVKVIDQNGNQAIYLKSPHNCLPIENYEKSQYFAFGGLTKKELSLFRFNLPKLTGLSYTCLTR